MSGCRTLRAPDDPEHIWTPPGWQATGIDADREWSSIRREKGVYTGEFTLAELVDIALGNNPSTRQAWQDARSSAALEQQARSSWYPSITGSGDLTKQKKISKPPADDLNTRNYGMQVEATMLVFDFGGRSADIKQARNLLLASNFTYNKTFQDVLLRTEVAYYELYSAQSNLDAYEADVEDARTSYEAARKKFEVGLVSKLDELQAKSNYDDSLYSLEDARGKVKTAQGNLAQVIGLPADTSISIVPPEEHIPTDLSERDVSSMIDEALADRPDVSASRAALKAAEAAVSSAFSDLLPTLNVGGSAEKRWYDYFGEDKAYETYYDYTGYLSVEWDIFDGFSNYARVQQARAEAESERQKLIETELAASADVWTKYYDFRTAIKKLKFSKAFLETAQASYDLAVDAYNQGLKDILDLLQAQSKLSEARSQLIGAKKDLFISLVNLIHATGTLGIEDYGEGADRTTVNK